MSWVSQVLISIETKQKMETDVNSAFTPTSPHHPPPTPTLFLDTGTSLSWLLFLISQSALVSLGSHTTLMHLTGVYWSPTIFQALLLAQRRPGWQEREANTIILQCLLGISSRNPTDTAIHERSSSSYNMT